MTKDQAMQDGATPLYSGGMAVAASRVVSVAIYKIGDAVRKVTDTSDKATITEWVGPPRRSRRLRKRKNCKWCCCLTSVSSIQRGPAFESSTILHETWFVNKIYVNSIGPSLLFPLGMSLL